MNKIDEILYEFYLNGGEIDIHDKNGLKFYKENRDVIIIMQTEEYNLLTRKIGRYIKLTEKGKEVCSAGCWSKWKRKQKRNKVIRNAVYVLSAITGLYIAVVSSPSHWLNKDKEEKIEINKEHKESQIHNQYQDSLSNQKTDSLTKNLKDDRKKPK